MKCQTFTAHARSFSYKNYNNDLAIEGKIQANLPQAVIALGTKGRGKKVDKVLLDQAAPKPPIVEKMERKNSKTSSFSREWKFKAKQFQNL